MAAWRQEQDKEKEAAGDAWADSGFEFTDELGSPLHPAAVTDVFQLIAYLAGLPPDPAARPAPRRRHPAAGRRARHEGRPGNPRPVVHHHRRRHLHQRAARTRPPSAEDVAALIRPAGQAPAKPARRRAAGKPRASPAARPPRTPARPEGEHDDQQQPRRPRPVPAHAAASRRTPATPPGSTSAPGSRSSGSCTSPARAPCCTASPRAAAACTRPSSAPARSCGSPPATSPTGRTPTPPRGPGSAPTTEEQR